MRLPQARGPNEDDALAGGDEALLEGPDDHLLLQLGTVGEIELFNRLLEGKAGAFQPAPRLVVLAGQNLLVEQPLEKITIGQAVLRGTLEPRFVHISDARQF